MLPDTPPPFICLGPAVPDTPVVIAVPHAGRAYPPALLEAVRVDRTALELLEDRYADLLVADAVTAGVTALVARSARAWIDLNRDPRELDPAMVAPPPAAPMASAKVRGGLGLIPHRLAGHGDIYPRPLAAAEVARRVAVAHAPWHEAIGRALAATRARFGVAVLLDLHSMPPLTGAAPPLMVVGDRYRASAAPDLVAATMALGADAALRPALNAPYAGGYALERHGRPYQAVHAIQIELCRSLYLDAAGRAPGPGMDDTRRFVAALARRLADQVPPVADAAE